MSAWSPTLEGFRSVFRRPALPLAEIIWRWSFGSAAGILLVLGLVEYLNTLPVSSLDVVLLRTRQPWLISQAITHIFRGSGLRLVLVVVPLVFALAILWISIASIGRAATLDTLLEYIRVRALAFRQATDSGAAVLGNAAPITPARWRFRSLAGLHFLRAALALAACAGCIGALILAGFVSPDSDPHPGLALFVALIILLLVWTAWSSVSWFLALASIFVVSRKKDAFAALASAVALCRDRTGPIVAVGTWFGVAHLVIFMTATSVVTFPLAFLRVLPLGVALLAVVLLTLLDFANGDALYIGRRAGYVAILEAPPAPAAGSAAQLLVTGVPPKAGMTQHSVLRIESRATMVDQDELILSDQLKNDPAEARMAGSQLNVPTESDAVDRDELILSDDARPGPDLPDKDNHP